MPRRQKRDIDAQVRTIKMSTLVIGLVVGLAFSTLIGVTGVAMGLGSIYPQINRAAKPFVCAEGRMEHAQQVSKVATATYYTARWYCVDEASGSRAKIDPDSIFIVSGVFYGLIVFGLLLLTTYLYWNSSIGPAKNGGPRLW